MRSFVRVLLVLQLCTLSNAAFADDLKKTLSNIPLPKLLPFHGDFTGHFEGGFHSWAGKPPKPDHGQFIAYFGSDNASYDITKFYATSVLKISTITYKVDDNSPKDDNVFNFNVGAQTSEGHGSLSGIVKEFKGNLGADSVLQTFSLTLEIRSGTEKFTGATGTIKIKGETKGGYTASFHADGDIILDEDRDFRPLTDGETAMAKTIFGDTIRYKDVTIYHHAGAIIQPDDTTMSPDGNIYFPLNDKSYRKNFSIEEPSMKCHFIHEMTHVKQYQYMGYVSFKSTIAGEWAIHSHNGNYNYLLKNNSVYGKDFTLEQQATIASDYYGLKNFGRQAFYKDILPHWTTIDPPSIGIYEKVLQISK